MTQGAQDGTKGGLLEDGSDKLGERRPSEPWIDSGGVKTTEEGIRG